MNKDRQSGKDKIGNPAKVYRDEMHDKGSTFTDTAAESKARDMAKVNKSLSGQGQKMDSVSPDELKPDRNDRIIEEERSDD